MKSTHSKTFLHIGLLLLFVTSYQSTQAQVERQRGNYWYFGNQYGLDFTTGQVQVNNSSAMFTYESSIAMSDKSGQLLFYTNGGGRVDGSVLGNIWNRNHEVMEGGEMGSLKGGGYSSSQGALSFQKPGTEDQYYLFTIDELETLINDNNPFPQGKGLSYFEIDMSANGGLGRVTTSNENILTPAFEHMSATKHGNCMDYWLLARTGHGYLSDDPSVRDSFYLFEINEDGIQTPLITAIPDNVFCTDWESGLIRFAPDGQHFTCGSYLFDFDKNTGSIGDFVDLESYLGINPDLPLAFSSNGELLYFFNVINEGSINAPAIKFFCVQYDVITEEVYAVSEISYGEDESPVSNLVGTPQLAPDGKMYIPFHHGINDEPTRIYAIDFPNLKGAAAQFYGPILELSPLLTTPILRFGNFTDHIFYIDTLEEIEVEVGDLFIQNCQEVEAIVLSAPAEYECRLWSTGDTSQTIEIMEEGIYWIELAEGCDIGRDSFEVRYENDLFEIDLGADTTLCEGEEVLLLAEALTDAVYEWQDSTTLPFLYAGAAGQYWVEARLGNCYDQDSINIEIQALPIVDLGNDTIVCEELGLLLDASHPANAIYEWQDGSEAETFQVVDAGIYSVTVSNFCGALTDEIFINLIDCEDCTIEFPNAFSPNNDGYGEAFSILTNCSFTNYQLKIFNRWGALVFAAKDPAEIWDGTQNGEISPSDVYFYLLEYETINPLGAKDQGRFQGDITLIR